MGGRRRELNRNRVWSNAKSPRRTKDIGEQLFRLAWLGHIPGEEKREIAFGIGAGDADSVDEELSATVMLNELAGEFSVADASVLWNGRPEFVDGTLLINRGVDDPKSTLMLRVLDVVAGEDVPRVALTNARGATRDVESPSGRVGHHAVGIDGDDLARVEVIDPPALVGVLEAVLLSPAAAHDPDEAFGRALRAGEQINLSTIPVADSDPSDARAPSSD